MSKVRTKGGSYPPTQQEVRDQFGYDPDSGELWWKVSKQKRKPLHIKNVRPDGYQQLRFNGNSYLTHQIIWVWFHGYYPEYEIDHIDRDPTNNKIGNLREVTRQCNLRNRGVPCHNTSGVVGVRWDGGKYRGKWSASIMVDKKERRLGRFVDFVEAVAHRYAAEQCLNWADCDKSSSAYLYLKMRGA